ncbi:MAG: alpha-L-arabinofuranosidase C-terminal domain-containing protein [Candidatus Gallimonas sp.]
MNKRIVRGILMGAVALAFVVSAAGCGPSVTADEEAPAYASPDATLSLTGAIDKTGLSSQISEDLFGLFLEDINYASYALDDNMAVNGSFEYAADRDYGWTTSGATLSVQTGNGIHGNNPYYAKFSVTAGGSLSNAGYSAVPIFVEYGVDYVFSAFLRNYGGNLTVQVVGKNAPYTVYAEKTVAVSQSAEWVKYEVTLTGVATSQENVVLKLIFDTAASDVCLDSVLFETTDSTVGIKNYIYRAIADLSPEFLRFPGGCVVEGTGEQNRYDWKNSIGAEKSDGKDELNGFTYTLNRDGTLSTVTTYGEQATRVPDTDIWQRSANYYEMEYGLGFYEYFLLCDSLGAKAVPVVSCGYSCQTQTGGAGNGVALSGRHGNGIEDFIRDAKDLVCFAKGSVNSSDPNEAYWARVRANMGHPEPFEMDYLGIGNEQWGEYYTQYYEKFLESFRNDENPLYQSVKLIVGNCTLFQNCENPATGVKGAAQQAALNYAGKGKISSVSEYGVHDQHYYMNYTDFLANASLYDDYARPEDRPDSYYEVFVGEYSANSEAARSPVADDNLKFTEHFSNTALGHNTWFTALSEAAMMTGFERNGDIVKLAAYAPMFGMVWDNSRNDNQWWVDMMYLTNTEIVLTPNYYVQQLFMKNAGDYKVSSSLLFAGETPQTTYTATNGTTRLLDDVYYVVSMEKETGDLIVKIVNVGGSDLKFNVDLGGLVGTSVGKIATVTSLNAEPSATSTLSGGSAVLPRTYTVGSFGSKLGYTAPAYSLTTIRIPTV